ncbi:MAG: alpha/beta hydrolase [Alphaproteobacteria bacterium]
MAELKKEFTGSLQNPQGANFAMSELPAGIEVLPFNLKAEDGAPSKGMLYRKQGTRPKVGVHLMHPRTDQMQNYNILPLAQAGYAVLGRASRWPNNDVATIHELLLLDVAAGVRLLKEQGCEKVVLLGKSGGSSLGAFYQAQARQAPGKRLTHTPAGDPPDLNKFDLPPADGFVIVGGHLGQGQIMRKMIDPSVVDESDPIAAVPELDLFDPRNGFRTPPESSRYSADFLARYAAAQLDRVRRIDTKARELIRRQRAAKEQLAAVKGDAATALERVARAGWHMVIYRTTADPASVDLNIDPDDRIVSTYSTGRPDLENYGDNGFGRTVTPRAWLSTWSALSSNAQTLDNLARIPDPLLIVHYNADIGTRVGEVKDMLARSASADKQLFIVPRAEHYGLELLPSGGTGKRSTLGTDKVVQWMRERFQP